MLTPGPSPRTVPGLASSPAPPLVPGRDCGDCNVCCIALTIDDPGLHKVQGVRCANALPDNRCGIYAARPGTCSTFHCGWRQLKWVRPSLRPDTSGVLIRLDRRAVAGTRVVSVIFTLLHKDALQADGLAEAMATAITTGHPVFLEVAGQPGYTYGAARMDEVLALSVQLRDKTAMLDILRQALAEGGDGPARPIVLDQRSGRPTMG